MVIATRMPPKVAQERQYDHAQRHALAEYIHQTSRDWFDSFYRKLTVGVDSALVIDHIEDSGPGGDPREHCSCGHTGLRWLFLCRPKSGALHAHLRPGKGPEWYAIGTAQVHAQAVKGDMIQIGRECIKRVLSISDAETRQLLQIGQEIQGESDSLARTVGIYGSATEYLRKHPVERWLQALQDSPHCPTNLVRQAESLLQANLPLPPRLEQQLRTAYDQVRREPHPAASTKAERTYIDAYFNAGLRSARLAEIQQWLKIGQPLQERHLETVHRSQETLPIDSLPTVAALIKEDDNVLSIALDADIDQSEPEKVGWARKIIRGQSSDGVDYFWPQKPLQSWQRRQLFGLLAAHKDAVQEVARRDPARVQRARRYWVEAQRAAA